MSTMKEQAQAVVGLSGVVGGGAYRKIGKGTWEARQGEVSTNVLGEDITQVRPWLGVGQAHSSEEAG